MPDPAYALMRRQWELAIDVARQVARERGRPVGSQHGPVSYGAQCVERALCERLAAMDAREQEQ